MDRWQIEPMERGGGQGGRMEGCGVCREAERRKVWEDVRYGEVSGGKGGRGRVECRKGLRRGSIPGVVSNNSAMLAVKT
ncbi:hypothetical protein PoB_003713600 [Plakobranchus ocellatus]|uniref:Uncharacterized protein n=1 Tax=Plakobranchus ocellatus TaxID=259542 RepID=A0AAV4AHH3_9GAST|nr:hypothetical protein PoB_003713600 [Plakobranchus ocellatus]